MRDYLLQLKMQTVELWQRMTGIQKFIIGFSAVVLIGTLVLLARGATKPDFGALFTQLDDQSAGQIVEKLKEMKISYQLSDGGTSGAGTSILVPTKDIDQTRIDLANTGLPTGGVVGFESFDTTKFGETDTDRRARYLRALQGELTRTIEGMAEVDKARVHIVQPEPSLFMDEQKNATAAVMLKLSPNHALEEGQVQGLVKLIANSVEGLKPENVTIVDMAGNNLTENLPAGPEAKGRKLTTDQLAMQQQLQKEVQANVQSMLERIFGLGKAVVRMQMQLDFDKIQKKSQEWGPNKVVRSQSVSEKTSNNTSTGFLGVPGTTSNIPGYTTPDQTGTSESTESEKITNNEINLYETLQEVAPGSVKKLSVAVVIDKSLNSQEQKVIEDMVKSAVGFDTGRGDQISVAGMPFSTADEDAMNEAIAQAEKQRMMMIYGGIAVLAILVIGIVIGSIVVRKRRSKEFELPLTEEQINQEAATMMQIPIEREEPVAEPEISAEAKELMRRREQVEKVAKEHPDDVAQLLRTWLAEE
ncbi:MAG: flagellar basal-body MS-ring/collar protein FliF [Thermincola sp.]|jgi:flagellar M-ring protein FliF|nr:flagellar basal-body MS-ring/collar protein FliF [Thermincola sp.]MDT3701796.1 flagellar basal-body MS-ring/collar protein FliF [Thermincola sp.]